MEEIAEKLKREIDQIETDIGWKSFFQVIRTESSKYDFPCSQAKAPANRLLNRYRDVSPFDHSIVVLQNGPCDYINASFVKVEKAGRNYILTQGALPHTSGHFWLMIWEQKSKAILMLNKIMEKNQIKCHQYWPIGKRNGDDSDVMEFNDVGIRVYLKSENSTRNFVVRSLITGNQREVVQFHYTTWPDFGVPSTARAFLHFLQIVRDSDFLSSKYGPAVVHCSAGIGRSGTFCLVDSCLLMMEQGLDVNVKDVLIEMRKYRTGMIQTVDQLQFSYMAILEGCHQLADGNKAFLPDLEGNEVNGKEEESPIPLPPARTSSVSPTDDQYRRLIEMVGFKNGSRSVADRPLPPLPDSSSSEEGSSEDDIIDDDDEDESKSYGLLNHVNQNNTNSTTEDRKSSFSEVGSLREDSRRGSEDIQELTTKTSNEHGLNTSNNDSIENDESGLRRRAKNEATMAKIREIRAKQKETEVKQGLYRSITGNKYLWGFLALSAFAVYCYANAK